MTYLASAFTGLIGHASRLGVGGAILALGLNSACQPSEERGRQFVPRNQNITQDTALTTQAVLVLLGASWCGDSRRSGLQHAFSRISRETAQIASRKNETFVSIGVALDRAPKKGLRWLEEVGSFNEIISGSGWLNSGAIAYIWRDVPGPAALPQILLIRRLVRLRGSIVEVDSVILQERWIGTAEIIRRAKIAEPGLRLPSSSSPDSLPWLRKPNLASGLMMLSTRP